MYVYVHAETPWMQNKQGQVGITSSSLAIPVLLRFSHFMQLFTITCKQMAAIVVANNNLQQLNH